VVCEARAIPDQRAASRKPSPSFGIAAVSPAASDHSQLLPRSHPTANGARRITIEARSGLGRATYHLTAGEAAELMFELGFALEQAARDEAPATPVRSPLETPAWGAHLCLIL
jgi:hypothetical protein